MKQQFNVKIFKMNTLDELNWYTIHYTDLQHWISVGLLKYIAAYNKNDAQISYSGGVWLPYLL